MIRITLIVLAALTAAPVAARLIVFNANGYTLDSAGKLTRFETLIVGDDGKVEATKPRSTSRTPAAPRLRRGDTSLDAKGRTLLPGLIDAHGHVMGLGYQALAVDLTDSASLTAALATVTSYATANPGSSWITGRGWNQERWPGKAFPTAADLDRVTAGRPAYLERIDGHAGWANAAALKLAGIGATTADPPGGRIERDAAGAPTGILIDAATILVEKIVPPPTPEQSARALDKALEFLSSVGLTQVADMGTLPAEWVLFQRYAAADKLSVRIASYAAGMDALGSIAPAGPIDWSGSERLALLGVKLYGDGALGSRGAWLKADYADAPGNRGLRFNDDAALGKMVRAAAAKRFDIAYHAIGDAANAQALDAFAALPAAQRGRIRARIEHAQIVDTVDLPRFRALGVVASMQPTHATSDKGMAEARIGEARLAGGYAWATLVRSGAAFAGGSDFPVEPANPFFGIHAAVTRQDRDGQPAQGWRPDEALTRVQAFAAFTTGAAHANRSGDRTGTLVPGKWADFILADRDPFMIPAADLWRVQVDETWLAGKRVFKRAVAP